MRIVLLAACSTGAIMMMTGSAAAQTAPASAPPEAAPPAGAPDANSSSGPPAPSADIVVTGSRIARRNDVSNSPIVTLGAGTIQSTGSSTVETALNELPQVTASASSSANFNGRGGVASVDLRGLGQQRTLVLLDGLRLQPSNPDGSVDLNIIPTNIITDVEVITGGASAVYGSDAVTGVVNFKLRTRFTGAQLSALSGITQAGDGANQDISGLVGTDFADHRGNVFLSADYAHRSAVDFTGRSYLTGQALSSRLPEGTINVNAANLPSQAAVNAVFARYGVAPGTVSRSTPFAFNTDGTLFSQTGPTNYRDGPGFGVTTYNGSVLSVPGDYFFAQTPLDRVSIFGRSEFQVSPSIKIFAQGLYTGYTVTTQGPPVVAGSGTSLPLVVPTTNSFIPADLAAILASRPNPTAPFTIVKELEPLGDRGERDRYDVYQITAGASGALTRAVTWSVNASYGRTSYKASELDYPSSSAINRLLGAADGGRSLCDGGLNPFGLQPLSASCIAYVERDAQNRTTLSQQIVEANVQGKALDLPAGELRFAAGVDYRKSTYQFTPAPGIASGDLANYLPTQGSNGSTNVKEVYGEALIPLLKDVPLIRSLGFDVSYRYSDYDSVGGVSTYKGDADWVVVDGLRLRGGYSRATRAPSVGELFTAQTIGTSSLGTIGPTAQGDPCDVRSAYRTSSATAAQTRTLCLAQGIPAALIDTYQNTNPNTNFVTSGNRALKAETADTYSVGVQVKPRFGAPLLSGFSLSVDYYNIRLDGAIGIVTSATTAQRCFNADGSNPTYSNANYYCGLITRNAGTGLIDQVVNPELNLGGYATDGIDVEADWRIGLGDVGLPPSAGKLTLSSNVNYLRRFKIQTLQGAPFLDYAGTLGNTQIDAFADAHPRWKATSTATYGVGALSTTLRWRYIGPMANAANVGTNGTNPSIQSVSYFDLDATLQVNKRFDFRFGVTNLGNRQPPIVNTNLVGQYGTDLYTYDLIGRRFYVAATARF